jgi:hypothetical protein
MSVADESPLRDLPDRAIRQGLQHPEHLRDLLRQVVPDLAEGFDCSQMRLLDREFPLDDWRRREADLPLELPYRRGPEATWALVVVLVEHQSDPDVLMPLRLLYFAVLYWDKQWRQWAELATPRPPLRLRPVLPIVLYTGERPWTAGQRLVDLLGEPKELHALAPSWQPLFWNLRERSPEELLAASSEWLKTLAVIRAVDRDAHDFFAIFRQAVHDIAGLAGADAVRWYDLMRVILTWGLWRRPEPERTALVEEAKASQQERIRQREVDAMSTRITGTIADIAMAKGMAEGMAKGEVKSCREALLAILEERFGTLPPDLPGRIAAMSALEELRRAIRQAIKIQKLEELQL